MSDKSIEAQAPARIVSSLPRSKAVPLDWPVEFGGTIHDSITVRRITTREIADYVEALTVKSPQARKLPTIDCPIEVWDAMDGDDMANVEMAARDFLPRRLREALETLIASESTPASGEAS